MKRCSQCEKVLPLDAFHKHPATYDRRRSKCRECASAERRKNRAQRRAYYAAYDREYKRTPEGREARRRGALAHRLRCPEKMYARKALQGAVRTGKIIRQPCVMCSSPKSQGHHEDYSKPLEVIWLCASCHAERHHGKAA